MMIRTRALDHTQLTYVLAALRRARGQKTYAEYEKLINSLDPDEVWEEAEKEGIDTEGCYGADDVAGELLFHYAAWNPFSRWGDCWELLIQKQNQPRSGPEWRRLGSAPEQHPHHAPASCVGRRDLHTRRQVRRRV